MKNINDRQSSEDAVKMAAAFRQAYKMAKHWKAVIWIFVFLLSIAQVVTAFKLNGSSSQGFTALLAALTFINLALMTFGNNFKVQKYLELGSNLQRLHDNLVLKAGSKPNALEFRQSSIERMSEKWLKNHSDDINNLKEWWPKECSEIPEPFSQTACLLGTLNWEKELREKYLKVILFISFSYSAALITIGLIDNASLSKFILELIMPSVPLLSLFLNESLASMKAKSCAEQCASEALNIWKIKNKASQKEYTERQEEIIFLWHKQRATTTPIFNWLYNLTQKTMNKDMIIDAKRLIEDAKKETP